MIAKKIIEKLGYNKFISMPRLTTIRNPYSRLVSMFYFQQAMHPTRIPEIPSDLNKARARFDEWLNSYAGGGRLNTKKGIHHAKTDYFIVHYEGKLLTTNYIRVENLRSDFNKFCVERNIDPEHITLSSERDNSASKKFKSHELFCNNSMISQAQKIDAWVFNLNLYPDTPRSG